MTRDSSSLEARRPHKPEVGGSNPPPATKGAYSKLFLFENILTQLVEYLSVKQSVAGSNPVCISLAP